MILSIKLAWWPHLDFQFSMCLQKCNFRSWKVQILNQYQHFWIKGLYQINCLYHPITPEEFLARFFCVLLKFWVLNIFGDFSQPLAIVFMAFKYLPAGINPYIDYEIWLWVFVEYLVNNSDYVSFCQFRSISVILAVLNG